MARKETVLRGERRTAIADAAIELLAQQGTGRLTHRAIDAALTLPNGSTSYYFRTQEALLTAAAQRLAELDEQSGEAFLAQLQTGQSLSEVVTRWLDYVAKHRLIARFELYLEAIRRPELQEVLIAPRVKFEAQAVRVLSTYNIAHPQQVAQMFMYLIEGMTINRLVQQDPLPQTQAVALLVELLDKTT